MFIAFLFRISCMSLFRRNRTLNNVFCLSIFIRIVIDFLESWTSCGFSDHHIDKYISLMFSFFRSSWCINLFIPHFLVHCVLFKLETCLSWLVVANCEGQLFQMNRTHVVVYQMISHVTIHKLDS